MTSEDYLGAGCRRLDRPRTVQYSWAVPAPEPAAIDYKSLVQDDRIHAALYTDPRIFADELERTFHRGWVFVGHDSEIPRPGDFVTRTLGTEPVLMVRDRNGSVAVLVNRCMHRGTQLCTAVRGQARTGLGHIEIDWSPGYPGPFEWLGNASGPGVDAFEAALERRDGAATARRRVVEGPAHALIFSNLFLGETNVAIVQPVAVDECVHWHTPMFLGGSPQLNGRLLRMAEAGMGPASFLMPDDLVIAARNQRGLAARTAPWLLLARGLERERVDDGGRRVSHVTDETTNRGFWRHYRTVMTEA